MNRYGVFSLLLASVLTANCGGGGGDGLINLEDECLFCFTPAPEDPVAEPDPVVSEDSSPGFDLEVEDNDGNQSPAIMSGEMILEPGIHVVESETSTAAFIALVYESIYDVHPAGDPDTFLRSQPGAFDAARIFSDLEQIVESRVYDFVLVYSLTELPGWIGSGPRCSYPAANIGLPNESVGQRLPACGQVSAAQWPRLKSSPHMNAVDIIAEHQDVPGGDWGLLVASHEIAHYWGVYWGLGSGGPRKWQPGDPLAQLAAASGHWSWNWIEADQPGIMYSGPSGQFNAFDLYGMGLMPYAEVRDYHYLVHENENESALHTLGVEDLVANLRIAGAKYFSAEGKRVPPTDSSSEEINVLLVLVAGSDERLSDKHRDILLKIADELPQAWHTATWGRSTMSSELFLR